MIQYQRVKYDNLCKDMLIYTLHKQMNISTPCQTFKDIIHKYHATVEDEALKPPNIPLHGLRHTSATMLISEDVDVRTVSARLGHAQTSTTMNIYAHSLKESDKKAADKLDKLFNNTQQQKQTVTMT